MFARIISRPPRVMNVYARMKLSTPPSGATEARAARRARTGAAPVQTASSTNKYFIGGIICLSTIIGLSMYAANDIKSNPKGTLATMYKGSILEQGLTAVYKSTIGKANEIFDPASDKVMPDWPTSPIYANVPPGTPCPPLLILDLERTLVGSVHDYQYGWRHVKRPGLDKFIKALSQYYEVLIFSENDMGVVQEILEAIDPENMVHKVGSSAGEMRGQQVLKRLDNMNRDPRRILIIDDNAESVELCQDNALLVKPFLDVNSKTDKTLENLIPLLQAFIHDGVQDFPRALRDLGTNDAEEAVAEYRMRISEVRQAENKRRNRGLGGLLRGPASATSEDDGFAPRSAVLSPADIVGSSAAQVQYDTALNNMNSGKDLANNYFNKDKPKPSSVKKKGLIAEALEKKEAERAQRDLEKQNLMNEIYQQRMMKKAAAANSNVSEQ